jgi:hypothetical protein
VHLVLLDQYLHVHSISCPWVSPQQEAGIGSVATDQAPPDLQGSSDQHVAQSPCDKQSLEQTFPGVQGSCKAAACSSQSF